MDYNTRSLERLSKDINTKLEDELNSLGIFFRVFYRYKKQNSLEKKLSNKNKDGSDKYRVDGKRIQDIIGLRINLYFADDLDLVYKICLSTFKFVDETIDKNEETEFKPTRINVIYKIPTEFKKEFRDVIPDERIDDTFELQLRTVLSEGWHEVDHDLRYKNPKDWENHSNLARTFNGILASLETNDWSILKLFQELAMSHYKNGNWKAMLRTKLRLRIEDKEVSNDLHSLIEEYTAFQRELFKIKRIDLINYLKQKRLLIPLTLENLIFIMNFQFIKDEKILELTPQTILRELHSEKSTLTA